MADLTCQDDESVEAKTEGHLSEKETDHPSSDGHVSMLTVRSEMGINK
jgi:hypothetical protein